MKKRDLYWVNKISIFLLITLFFGIISIFNIIQFNASYMAEEQEELQVFKRQIEWAIELIIENRGADTLQEYCNEFLDEDVEVRIFDENKKLIATSNPENKTPLLSKDSEVLNKGYSNNKLKLYKYAVKNRKIGVRDKIYVNGHKYYVELTISQADVMKSIMSVQKNSLIFFAICLMFFIFGLISVFYTLRKSFNKLEDSVIKISNGELDTTIIVPEDGLLEELSISVKRMTQKLKMQIKRLSQLEQYKTEFIQNLTHEIKTPITAINSAVELIELNKNDNETNDECFNIIKSQIGSINKLVGDILELSELDLKKTEEEISFQSFSLVEAVKEAITNQGISSCKINLIIKEDIVINANKELIITAVSNLLSNAIKYSASKNIDVIISKTGQQIVLEVKDYGCGISSEHLPRIFERFYRVDKSRSRVKGGTGLGLSIVKNIVELHNWDITVESEINKGTSFKIIIP